MKILQLIGLGWLRETLDAILRAQIILSTLNKTLIANQEKIMADLSKLAIVTDKLAADFTSLDTDARAYFAANPPADPAAQAQVDAITAKLGTIATGLESLDAASKAAPEAPTV